VLVNRGELVSVADQVVVGDVTLGDVIFDIFIIAIAEVEISVTSAVHDRHRVAVVLTLVLFVTDDVVSATGVNGLLDVMVPDIISVHVFFFSIDVLEVGLVALFSGLATLLGSASLAVLLSVHALFLAVSKLLSLLDAILLALASLLVLLALDVLGLLLLARRLLLAAGAGGRVAHGVVAAEGLLAVVQGHVVGAVHGASVLHLSVVATLVVTFVVGVHRASMLVVMVSASKVVILRAGLVAVAVTMRIALHVVLPSLSMGQGLRVKSIVLVLVVVAGVEGVGVGGPVGASEVLGATIAEVTAVRVVP
jgi:hypothetical protein